MAGSNATTLVFLDESGDPGFKFGAGSSIFFVVTLVLVPDGATAAALDHTIANLRLRLRTPKDYEFHFTDTCPAWREAFMKEINGFAFRYHSIVINKPALTGEGFLVKESFYKFACRIVLQNAARELNNATVVLDGCGSREFQRQLRSYLRRAINDPQPPSVPIKKLKIQDSRRQATPLHSGINPLEAVGRGHVVNGKCADHGFRVIIAAFRGSQVGPGSNQGRGGRGKHLR